LPIRSAAIENESVVTLLVKLMTNRQVIIPVRLIKLSLLQVWWIANYAGEYKDCHCQLQCHRVEFTKPLLNNLRAVKSTLQCFDAKAITQKQALVTYTTL